MYLVIDVLNSCLLFGPSLQEDSWLFGSCHYESLCILRNVNYFE